MSLVLQIITGVCGEKDFWSAGPYYESPNWKFGVFPCLNDAFMNPTSNWPRHNDVSEVCTAAHVTAMFSHQLHIWWISTYFAVLEWPVWAILTPTSCESCVSCLISVWIERSTQGYWAAMQLSLTWRGFFPAAYLIPSAAWGKMVLTDWADIGGVFPVWSSSFTGPYTDLHPLFSVNVLMTCRRKQWLYCVCNLVLEFYARLTAFPSDLLTWVNLKITIDSTGCH